MQTCSANTSASRKTRTNKALNQYNEPSVQLLKGGYSYIVASTVGVTACWKSTFTWRNASDRETVAACNIICSLHNYTIQLLSRPHASPSSHAVGSNPYGLGRSLCMTSECSSLRCICLQALSPSSGLGSLYSSETWIFTYQNSRCQNINNITVRTTNITRHNIGHIFQQIMAQAAETQYVCVSGGLDREFWNWGVWGEEEVEEGDVSRMTDSAVEIQVELKAGNVGVRKT
jgi:hypothetical protein